jgi:hypothetical protein
MCERAAPTRRPEMVLGGPGEIPRQATLEASLSKVTGVTAIALVIRPAVSIDPDISARCARSRPAAPIRPSAPLGHSHGHGSTLSA